MKLSSIETKWFHTRGSDEPLLLLGLLFLLIHLLFQRPLPRLAEVFFGFLRLRGLGEGGIRGGSSVEIGETEGLFTFWTLGGAFFGEPENFVESSVKGAEAVLLGDADLGLSSSK